MSATLAETALQRTALEPDAASGPRIPFILSCARSGSTWLGKVFDSHPDVFYLHEPDMIDRGLDLVPFWFSGAPTSDQVNAARAYVHRLADIRAPRSVGTRPYFRKGYRSGLNEVLRRGLIHAVKGFERAGVDRYLRPVNVPDLARAGGVGRCVIKSVNSLGRVESLLRGAADLVHPILLLRHPCGYVRSQLRGIESGVMGPAMRPGRLLETRAARRLGVRELVLAVNDPAEQLTWNWLLANAEAYDAMEALGGGTTVVYESLLGGKGDEIRALFAKVGVSWAPE
ncbi:MAG: hypothetical protein ABL996_07600, partial [Micropepsaceae bacterium]